MSEKVALYWLNEGDSLDDVYRAVVVAEEKEVDTEDFAAALENPQSE